MFLHMSGLHSVVEDDVDLCKCSTFELWDINVRPNRAQRAETAKYEANFALFTALVLTRHKSRNGYMPSSSPRRD